VIEGKLGARRCPSHIPGVSCLGRLPITDWNRALAQAPHWRAGRRRAEGPGRGSERGRSGTTTSGAAVGQVPLTAVVSRSWGGDLGA